MVASETPATIEMTRWSADIPGWSSVRTAARLCGLTARTSVSQPCATSTLEAVVTMPVAAVKACRAGSKGSLAWTSAAGASPARSIP